MPPIPITRRFNWGFIIVLPRFFPKNLCNLALAPDKKTSDFRFNIASRGMIDSGGL
jgi:hypothetical protein